MKFLKFFLALFLLIFITLPLLCQDYLIRVDFSDYKLFLINDSGIVIVAYPVAVPVKILNYLPLYGNVVFVENNPQVQIVIKFDVIDINPIIRVYGSAINVRLNKKSRSGCIVLQKEDIFQLIGIINGKQIKVFFEK